MTSRTSTLRDRLFFPLLAAATISTGAAVYLFAEHAALRQSEGVSGASTMAEPVYARTFEEAKARVVEDLSRGAEVPGPTDDPYPSPLGLCQRALRQDERAALSRSFTHKPLWVPELDARQEDRSDYAGEREQVAKILGAARHREVEATCKSRELERQRETAILTLSGYYGLSQSLTEQIRALALEKEQNEALEASDAQDRKRDELNGQFRALLGPQLWARYKLEVLRDQESGDLPFLYWLEGPLFSLPSDEAPAVAQSPQGNS